MGRESECQGKTPYETKGKAIERIHFQMDDRRRRKRQGRTNKYCKMEAYHCPHCGHWHVGSTIDRRTIWLREAQRQGIAAIDRALDRLRKEGNRGPRLG